MRPSRGRGAGPGGLGGVRAVQQRLAAQPLGDADGFADRGRPGLVSQTGPDRASDGQRGELGVPRPPLDLKLFELSTSHEIHTMSGVLGLLTCGHVVLPDFCL
jgi:hypothetical protein